MLANRKQLEIPFLFPEVTKKTVSENAFDVAMASNQLRPLVQNMFDYMVYCDIKGLLYQEILERNIDNFIDYKMNFKKFFESSMPIYEHSNFDVFP